MRDLQLDTSKIKSNLFTGVSNFAGCPRVNDCQVSVVLMVGLSVDLDKLWSNSDSLVMFNVKQNVF